MVSNLARQLLESASARFDRITAALMESWDWPCSCERPGEKVGCIECPGFRLFVEDMQERLSQEQATNSFMRLSPLILKPSYSNKSRQNCLLLYQRGFNLTTIQRVTGVTDRKIIRQWLVEEGLLSLSLQDHLDQRQKCISLYKQGLKPHEIEDETSVPADAVAYWAKREGILRPKPDYTGGQKQECLGLYFEENLSYAQVSQRTGVPDYQIKQWIKDSGRSRERIYGGGKPPLYSDHDREECISLFQQGYTTQQVEEMTRISSGTLIPWLKEHCLELLEEGYPREEIEHLTGVGHRVLKKWWKDIMGCRS
jgi:hypothetical protein